MSNQTPKGEFCFGCGRICTGVHLDYHLLPDCSASYVIFEKGEMTNYNCELKQGHASHHRDGRKEWK